MSKFLKITLMALLSIPSLILIAFSFLVKSLIFCGLGFILLNFRQKISTKNI
ncbi:hypothetical protein [Desulforamulus aquiferis]|uniref:Uncharacterized protein n=1 Tax=Desulforamulus aquiferis TaxID=1397668 RepID=A0AAW7ZEN6_9FIRM|nr:hypothetical protein [Desulforamulus aquiferis]MDO7787734.1 hypothetical protein [Desulforamulus aquiferis]